MTFLKDIIAFSCIISYTCSRDHTEVLKTAIKLFLNSIFKMDLSVNPTLKKYFLQDLNCPKMSTSPFIKSMYMHTCASSAGERPRGLGARVLPGKVTRVLGGPGAAPLGCAVLCPTPAPMRLNASCLGRWWRAQQQERLSQGSKPASWTLGVASAYTEVFRMPGLSPRQRHRCYLGILQEAEPSSSS